MGTIINLILQMEKLKHRKVKKLAQGHTTGKKPRQPGYRTCFLEKQPKKSFNLTCDFLFWMTFYVPNL